MADKVSEIIEKLSQLTNSRILELRSIVEIREALRLEYRSHQKQLKSKPSWSSSNSYHKSVSDLLLKCVPLSVICAKRKFLSFRFKFSTSNLYSLFFAILSIVF